MVKTKLQFLLIGKTGHGKSATGNLLLNRRSFRSSATVESVTKDSECNYSQFGDYTLLVVDSPGMIDTDLDKVKDIEVATHNMSIALGMCNGGVDAFLVVLKFGSRFTTEERAALDSLRGIFGQNYLNHAIIIMTYGDLFYGAMEEEGLHNITFQDWCTKLLTGEMKRLYQECQGRFVLFNNRERGEEKRKVLRQEVVRMAESLQNRSGRYTYTSFEKAQEKRERLVAQQQDAILSEPIQESVSLLVADLETFLEKPADIDEGDITKRAKDLIQNVKAEFSGIDSLSPLRRLASVLKKNLSNHDILKKTMPEMENIRKAKESWNKLTPKISNVEEVSVSIRL